MNDTVDDPVDGRLAFATTEATDISVLPKRLVRRPHILQIVAGDVAPRTIPLTQDSMSVGRSNEADIRIMTADLSRMHMRIDRTRRGFKCFDMDSRNGVFVNEVRVHSAVLRDGDLIQLGNVALMYHEGS
ncbi:MAG: FHA domain-containing protein [Myxococcales bacterium]|nr:FHA domain-containing protein [Myxococcales bacterium]